MTYDLDRFEPYFEHIVDDKFTRPVAEAFMTDICNRHSEPWRRYHVINHFVDVADHVLDNSDEIEALRPTLLMAISHDAIYIPEAPKGVNEERTAQLVEAILDPYIPAKEIMFSVAGIRATADHAWDGVNLDLAHALDGDMKIVGSPDDVFDEYDEGIEYEFSFAAVASPESYIRGRHRFMRKLAFTPRIYNTERSHRAYNDQARRNIGRKALELSARMPSLQLQDWDDSIMAACQRNMILTTS